VPTTAVVKVESKPYKRDAYIANFGSLSTRVAVAASKKKVKRKHRRRTPQSKRFFHPLVKMGWHKNLLAKVRRQLAFKAHNFDELATADSLQELANVTQDTKTKEIASLDARYFFRLHKRLSK
jgi:butyrate kinase